MKKIIIIGFLMFFIHDFILDLFFGRLDAYIPRNNGDTDHGIHFIIALFFTLMLYVLSIILAIIEIRMEYEYKNIMMLLVCGNCLLEFYMNSFSQYRLFSSPKRFDNTSIIIILVYFLLELFFTFYVINRLYKSNDD